MPLIKRKPVEMVPAPDPSRFTDDPDVFFMHQTGEIFVDYESYANRMNFYCQRIFQCELSGKLNMGFFEAMQSERVEAELLQRKFPESLKGPILRSVQFFVSGRLDQLVENVFDRFKDRFFEREAVYVDVAGDKFSARINSVFPPKALLKVHQESANAAAAAKVSASPAGKKALKKVPKKEDGDDSDSDLSDAPPITQEIKAPAVQPHDIVHRIGTDLDLEATEAAAQDPPEEYLYHVQLKDDDGAFVGSLMEVKASKLSRDRQTFSKAILKKFLKDCLVRDPAIGSPWVVKQLLAQRYGIPITPSDDVVKKNDAIRQGKLQKRKKLTEEEEEERKTAKKAKSANKAEEARLRKEAEEEAERKKADKERRKNLKYPIEDLELDPATERELKSKSLGEELDRRRDRPLPSRELPVPADIFESFLNTYYFLLACGKPLALSPFTLDDYEAALRHSTHEPSCTLLAEIHASLINLLVRDGPNSRKSGPAPVAAKSSAAAAHQGRNGSASAQPASRGQSEESDQLDSDRELSDEEEEEALNSDDEELSDEDEGEEMSAAVVEVFTAARALGSGWNKRTLKIDEGREGWEASLVGALARHGDTKSMPRLTGILSHLTGVEHPDGFINGRFLAETYSSLPERYPAMELRDKLIAIEFLCELAVSTKAAKKYFDDCDAQLTELRKERAELSRARKKLAEDRAAFDATHAKEEGEEGGEGEADGEAKEGTDAGDDASASDIHANGTNGVGDDSDGEQDELDSDGDVGSGSERGGGRKGRQEVLREKALLREAEMAAKRSEMAKQREAQKLKNAENKQLNAAKRKLDDEETRLNTMEERIDREFRRHALAPRLTPLGKDRFHDRYWWFDGIGTGSLLNAHGGVTYQTGRLFVQGASEGDWNFAMQEAQWYKPKQLEQRRREEHTEEGLLKPNEWAVYTEPEQVEQLLAWLRTKGNRELALKTTLIKFRQYMEPGMRKRSADVAGGWRETFQEARRSARTKTEASHTARLPYMLYRNSMAR